MRKNFFTFENLKGEYPQLNAELRRGTPTAVFGVSAPHKYMIASLVTQPAVYICADAQTAKKAAESIATLSGKKVALLSAKDEVLLYKAAISKALSALYEKGYIVLENGENKKYRSSYFLTDAGREIIERLNDKIRAAVSGGGTGLTDEERDIFYRCLSKIVTNLEEVSKNFSVTDDEE